MLRIAAALFVLAALALTHADPADARPRKKCYAWGQDGYKVKIPCPGQAEFEAEAEAIEKMKANKKPEPTTEHCYYVDGKLDCKPAP